MRNQSFIVKGLKTASTSGTRIVGFLTIVKVACGFLKFGCDDLAREI